MTVARMIQLIHFTDVQHEGGLLYPFVFRPTVGTVGVEGRGGRNEPR